MRRYEEYIKEKKIELEEYTLYGPKTNTHFDPIQDLDLEKGIKFL